MCFVQDDKKMHKLQNRCVCKQQKKVLLSYLTKHRNSCPSKLSICLSLTGAATLSSAFTAFPHLVTMKDGVDFDFQMSSNCIFVFHSVRSIYFQVSSN